MLRTQAPQSMNAARRSGRGLIAPRARTYAPSVRTPHFSQRPRAHVARALSLALLTCAHVACGDGSPGAGGGGDGAVAFDGGAQTDAGLRDDAGPRIDAGTLDGGAVDAGTRDGGSHDGGTEPLLLLSMGADLPIAARERFRFHIDRARSGRRLVLHPPTESPPATLPAGSLALAIGDTRLTRVLISQAERDALSPEGLRLRSGVLGAAPLLCADGRPADDARQHGNRILGNRGAAYAAYALLQRLGFAFLHPLAPASVETLSAPASPLDVTERPRWPIRGMQLHTMHPLELTDLLQGFGPAGHADEAGWRAMLPEWDRYLEWMLAHRQNYVHWVLLEAASWQDFSRGPTRLSRLRELVERAHAFGVRIGVDAPIVLAQQHAFRLIPQMGNVDEEKARLRATVDWLMGAGFDYLATESGTSEFTHPEPARMLAWMNELAVHLAIAHGKPAYIKIHASQGQVAQGYPDPVTGLPINFNFLPHHADARLGVMPHTVQHYALDDPAPTYNNTDFGYIRTFLRQEAGRRPVLWHPETAYWVSFDIDVPLFLPVYAERRVRDLRLLAADEAMGPAMNGQMVFSSGWEWGYWLNDVVAARAAWAPHESATSDSDALRMILSEVLAPWQNAKDDAVALLVETAALQRAQLIEGRVSPTAPRPANISRRNGQAYLQGYETWDDVADLAGDLGLNLLPPTQPDRLGLVEMRNPLHAAPGYSAEVEPLLSAMSRDFAALAARYDALRARVPVAIRELWDDLADAMAVTALRAKQVHGLYDYVDGYWDQPESVRRARLAAARRALDDAAGIVAAREPRYRVPAERVAAWRANPTAYSYGYLWTVRRLAFWWRDEHKAVDAPLGPCTLNFINPVNVGFGEGLGADAARVARDILDNVSWLDSLAECLAAPVTEPPWPPPGLRTRP